MITQYQLSISIRPPSHMLDCEAIFRKCGTCNWFRSTVVYAHLSASIHKDCAIKTMMHVYSCFDVDQSNLMIIILLLKYIKLNT